MARGFQGLAEREHEVQRVVERRNFTQVFGQCFARNRQAIAVQVTRFQYHFHDGGRAADLAPWLADAMITRDRDLRLQYLAGLGLNLHVGRSIYAEMLRYRRFPSDMFAGSAQQLWDLRAAIEGPKE